MSHLEQISASLGLQVTLTPYLIDGEVVILDQDSHLTGARMLIGTRLRTELELARHRGKWLAQQGLMDWLLYIGEKPIRKHPRTHRDVLTALRAHP